MRVHEMINSIVDCGSNSITKWRDWKNDHKQNCKETKTFFLLHLRIMGKFMLTNSGLLIPIHGDGWRDAKKVLVYHDRVRRKDLKDTHKLHGSELMAHENGKVIQVNSIRRVETFLLSLSLSRFNQNG